MKTAPTLLEISKILKLSPSTVSRALKNHPDIAPATRQKVLELADKLDYEPNLNAVGLRTSESKEIAVIVPDLSGFFYDSFISAVEEECRKLGFSVIILLSGNDPEVEAENVKICKQRRVRGVLACVVPGSTAVTFDKLARIKIPVVFFDKIPSGEGLYSVRVGDEEAARTAAEYLLKKHKTNILALFGDLKMSISGNRVKAFEEVFLHQGMHDRIRIREACSSADAEHIVHEAFSEVRKPDAVFCMSDEILIGVMKCLQTLGLKYPDQVGVLAISNGFFPLLYAPEITYVETSGYKLGKLAFSKVISYLEGDTTSGDFTLPSTLIERGSI